MKYIIIKNESIYHEGDQRSRDFPGHGYPAYTETVSAAKVYDDSDKFLAAVKYHTNCKHNFEAYEATQLSVKTETTVSISK
jgi:hypothetical protein